MNLTKRLRLTWQNLNERAGRVLAGEPQPTDLLGSMWKHGRAWLHRDVFATIRKHPSPPGDLALLARIEWGFGDKALGFPRAGVSFDRDDSEVTLSLSIQLASVWFTVPLPEALRDWLPFSLGREDYEYAGGHRDISIQMSDGTFRWSFWDDTHESRRSDPWWMHGHVDLAELAFGARVVEVTELEARDVLVPMPERAYRGKAVRELITMRRARLPFWSRQRMRVDIDMEDGEHIWIPGKGENSYDCGDDATSAMSTTAASIEEAIGKLVQKVLRDRWNRGGSHAYEPAETQTAH